MRRERNENERSAGHSLGSRYENQAARAGRAGRRRRGRGKRGAMYAFTVVFLILVIVCLAGLLYLYKTKDNSVSVVSVDLDSLHSPHAVLIDETTAAVLGSKNSDEMIYPASMTKIMTVLVAIESVDDLDATTVMDAAYYDGLYAQDASRAGFEPGEEVKLRDLLYGALLPSGAECCMQLSIEAAGSEEAFVELMNAKVKKLGLTQTNFVNCTGLHDDNQYTTVHEMGLILREALQNATFRSVFTTHYYTVSATSVHPDGFTFWSTLFKAVETEAVIGGEILGGKTGYTEEAGLCLASMAQVGDQEYILVTAGWASDPDAGQYHISDAFTGYNLLGEALGYGAQEQ